MANPWDVPVGYGVGTGMTGVDQVRTEARWAERAGFDTFWVSQIFGVDPVVALAAVGADVPGLRGLGTSVVPLAGRHPRPWPPRPGRHRARSTAASPSGWDPPTPW